MTIKLAECDKCKREIDTETDELYQMKTGDYCEDCVGYDNLTEEEYEEDDS